MSKLNLLKQAFMPKQSTIDLLRKGYSNPYVDFAESQLSPASLAEGFSPLGAGTGGSLGGLGALGALHSQNNQVAQGGMDYSQIYPLIAGLGASGLAAGGLAAYNYFNQPQQPQTQQQPLSSPQNQLTPQPNMPVELPGIDNGSQSAMDIYNRFVNNNPDIVNQNDYARMYSGGQQGMDPYYQDLFDRVTSPNYQSQNDLSGRLQGLAHNKLNSLYSSYNNNNVSNVQDGFGPEPMNMQPSSGFNQMNRPSMYYNNPVDNRNYAQQL